MEVLSANSAVKQPVAVRKALRLWYIPTIHELAMVEALSADERYLRR